MSFRELARDKAAWEDYRRNAFPFFQRKICLTHASVSPLPLCASAALASYATSISREGQFDYLHAATYTRCKERLARLIGAGAKADEVAFASSTSHALGIVATGIDWQPGDNCVVADGDFPANVVPWKNLERRGVEVRLIPYRAPMDIWIDDIAPLVDERTRIVSLASANFLSGYPLDLNAIGAWLHSRSVLFCVDAIQTLGAVSLDATHVDFVCADAHKWLLGPNGIAVLWARRGSLEKLHPAIMGWLSPRERDHWYRYDTNPIDNAERFEPGARNYLGAIALEASLAQHEEVDPEWIESRVISLRDYAARKLQEIGCTLLWEPDPDLPSGIVSFRPPTGETAALYGKLDQRFALSLRADRHNLEWIRVSPHWMNTGADIDELAAMIVG